MTAEIGTDLDRAANLLAQGQLVAIPTETVYGLAAHAYNAAAVAQVFAVKQRPAFDPLIVHFASAQAAEQAVGGLPQALAPLAAAFWPGPLTLLVPRPAQVPELVTAGLPRVGVRVPDHTLTLRLLERLPFPLAAPSANPFGYVSPTTPAHVARQLGGAIAYILDGGACRVGLESTVVGLEAGVVTVHRLGGIPLESVELVVGPVALRPHSTSHPAAPGQIESHYAPRVPVVLNTLLPLAELLAQYPPHQVGVLPYRTPVPAPQGAVWGWEAVLCPGGDLALGAQRLFGLLRAAEQAQVRVLWVEQVPELGLGRAINDRLRRAAAR